MAFIHITKERYDQLKQEENPPIIAAYFQSKTRWIKRRVIGKNQEEAYIRLDGKKYLLCKHHKGIHNHWWIK